MDRSRGRTRGSVVPAPSTWAGRSPRWSTPSARPRPDGSRRSPSSWSASSRGQIRPGRPVRPPARPCCGPMPTCPAATTPRSMT
ncbi:hypothetical protein ACFFX0_08010 [Citricoccus parietis]|uniref:Uncharacterized protein n=1 Tax=Citricoccus parietis TaxID=592307 RepID=A0ABV5FWS8_9MICC